VYNNYDFDFATQINTKNNKQGNNLPEKTQPRPKKAVLSKKKPFTREVIS